MAFALRTLLLASAAGLTACASDPRTPDRAPIDYRTSAPGARSPATPPVQAARSIPAPARRVVDMGASATGLSGIEEAKALAPEAGTRPGGPLRQPKDSKSKRTIQVQRGDTLYDISRRYSVNMRALIETNGLQPPYALDSGKTVFLPPSNVHVVLRGETLYSVSRRYNVDTRSLALLNNMSRPWTVWPGDELLLPPLARDQSRSSQPVVAGIGPAPPAPSVKPPGPKAVSAPAIADKPPVQPPPKATRIAETPDVPGDFIWPVSGQVLKAFGVGSDGLRNDGVNIAVDKGAQVKASADGEVVYAGSELSGFGNLILIRHAGGWVSAYAHSESVLVKEGELVRQGQPIASAGATGNASVPQVHFELRKGREPVDPSEHLPALRG